MIPPLVSPPDRGDPFYCCIKKSRKTFMDLLAVYTGKVQECEPLRRLTRTEQTACMC